MALRIPVLQSQYQPRGPGGITPHASGEAAGAGIGQALARAGATIADLGERFGKQQSENEHFDALTKEQQFLLDQELKEREAEQNISPDGSGYARGRTQEVERDREAFLSSLPPSQQQRFRAKMEGRGSRYILRAADKEYVQRNTHELNAVTGQINGLGERVRGDPDNHDTAVGEATEYLRAAKRLSPAQREDLQTAIEDKLSGARLLGLQDKGRNAEAEELKEQLKQRDQQRLEQRRLRGADAGGYSGAIASIESGGRYDELGKVIPKTGDRAYGKYQVMGDNVPGWTEKWVGRRMTPHQFLNDPDAQEKVFAGQFGSYVQKYGPSGAARAWFAGEGGMNDPNKRDPLGTTVAEYERKFNARISGRPVQTAQAESVTEGGFTFVRPVSGREITSPYGERKDPFGRGPALHTGADYRAVEGDPVSASAPGTVIKAGPQGAYGNLVEIDHGNGYSTRYGHLSSINVKEGSIVNAGASIGAAGSTGRATAPHLHFEVRKDGKDVDPEKFFAADAGPAATTAVSAQRTTGAPVAGAPAAASRWDKIYDDNQKRIDTANEKLRKAADREVADYSTFLRNGGERDPRREKEITDRYGPVVGPNLKEGLDADAALGGTVKRLDRATPEEIAKIDEDYAERLKYPEGYIETAKEYKIIRDRLDVIAKRNAALAVEARKEIADYSTFISNGNPRDPEREAAFKEKYGPEIGAAFAKTLDANAEFGKRMLIARQGTPEQQAELQQQYLERLQSPEGYGETAKEFAEIQKAIAEVARGDRALEAAAQKETADYLAFIRNGNPRDPVKEAEFKQKYGQVVGDAVGKWIEAGAAVGEKARTISGPATPKDITEIEAEYRERLKSSEGYQATVAEYKAIDAIIKKRKEALEADPAAFVAARSDEVKQAAQAMITAQQAAPEQLPGLSSDYAEATLAEQARLGVPEDQRKILPTVMVDAIGKQFSKVGGADTVQGIRQLETQWGNRWTKVFGELSKSLPGGALVIGSMNRPDQAAAAEDLAEAYKIGKKEMETAIGKEEDLKGKDGLAAKVAEKLRDFRGTLVNSPGAVTTFNQWQDGTYHLALKYVLHGKDSVENAATRAANEIVGKKFNIVGTARVPTEYNAGLIQAGTTQALAELIPATDIDLPRSLRGLKGFNTKADYVSSLQDSGFWVTAPDQSGLMLYDKERYAVTAGGKPYVVPWSTLERLGTGRTDVYPSASPAFP